MHDGLPHQGRNVLHTADGLIAVCPSKALHLSSVCVYPSGATEAKMVPHRSLALQTALQLGRRAQPSCE